MQPVIGTFSFAVIAGVFALSAHAESGRPSCDQMSRADGASAAVKVESSGPQPGSYAKYLMLNGVTREAAIKAAWSIDHPEIAGRSAEIAITTNAPSARAEKH